MHHLKRTLAIGLFSVGLAGVLSAEEAARVVQVFDGITIEFTPGREALAAELGRIAAASHRELAAQPDTARQTGEPPPLSIRDFQAHRAAYLARIAAGLGLDRATAQQEDCYDGFLENFTTVEQLYARILERMVGEVKSIALWDKEELLRRLKAGEKIPHFTLSPDGTHVSFAFNLNQEDPELLALLAKRQQRQLDYSYNLSSHDGVVDVSGHFGPRKAEKSTGQAATAPTSPTPPAEARNSQSFVHPAVITPAEADLPLKEQAAALFKNTRRLEAEQAEALAFEQIQKPSTLTLLLIHETTELGVVDHYLASADRRWLCEGVANYTGWRVTRDVAGEAAAKQVYDVQAQLAQFADLRSQINLRKWAAVENQKPAEDGTRLNEAHYAYATQAVFLMVQKYGEDFLPRLFREIGKTPRSKANMRTVEAAYRKLTGEKLDALLAAAVASAK